MKIKNQENYRTLNSHNHTACTALDFNEMISERIDSIGASFFQKLGITHFGYIKIFKNGTMFRMANNKEWTKEFFKREYYNDAAFYNMKNVSKEKRRLSLLTGEPQGEHLISLCTNFNIWNALVVYEKFNDYGELWFFGTSAQNTEAINFYINNEIILKKFTLYFKDKFSDELNNINDGNIIYSDIKLLDNNVQEQKNINDFFNEIKINYYKITDELSISKKEFKYLSYLIQGKTAKEIARLTDVSFRTVEFHLNNVKQKANCKKKSHLFEFLLNNKTFISLLDKF
jgi:DNA-binding CsgD family transcriptional regulator